MRSRNLAELLPRLVLGATFVVFGLDGLVTYYRGQGFLPMPMPTPAGGKFIGALIATGYFWPFLKFAELASGLLVLSGRFTALGLVVLAPITLNVFLYDVFLDPSGLPLGAFVLALHLWLAWRHRERYAPLFRA